MLLQFHLTTLEGKADSFDLIVIQNFPRYQKLCQVLSQINKLVKVNIFLIPIIMIFQIHSNPDEFLLYIKLQTQTDTDLKLLQAHPLLTAHHAFSIMNFHQENDFALKQCPKFQNSV